MTVKELRLSGGIESRTPDEKGGVIIGGYASTNKVNRYGYSIDPQAWVNAFPRKNPIVLYNHNADRAIGKVISHRVDERGLYVEALVRDKEIADKISDEILSDFSVKFLILGARKKETDGKVHPEVTRLDGIEVSVVSTPGDPNAQFSVIQQLNYELQIEKQVTQKEDDMELGLIMKALGLPENANVVDALNVIRDIQSKAETAGQLSLVAKSLNLNEDASLEDLRRAVATLRSPDNYIEKAKFDELEAELKELQVEALLAKHKDDIPEVALDYAREAARRGTEDFEVFLKTIRGISPRPPKRLGFDPTREPEDDKGKDMKLVAEELHFLKQMGHFRDVVENGRVTASAEEQYEYWSNITPTQALNMIFPDSAFQETEYDKAALAARERELA